MLKRKDLDNTLKRLDILEPRDSYESPEVFKAKRNLVKQYLSKDVFDRQLLNKLKMLEGINTKPKYAHEFLNQILDYKWKQAIKNGKTLKNDPRKRAFVDISDCLLESGKLDSKYNKYDLCKIYGEHEYGETKDSFITKLNYKGNICIPFDDCYIYTCNDLMGCIIDLKTKDDGKYSGIMYYLFPDYTCIQSSLLIERDVDNTWQIIIDVTKMQRPLGYPMCNVAALLSILIFGNFEKFISYFDYEVTDDLSSFVPRFNSSLSRMLLDALNYLGTYKSKYVYKLTKDNNTMYCYTTELGDNVKEYMQDHYPQYEYEKLDGWIVNGYWKILDSKETGKDKQGKPIKGFNWITPYSNEESTQVVSGEQQSNLVPIHAIKRAKERYNIDLTLQDLQEITKRCIKGKDVTRLTVRDKFGMLPKKDYKSGFTCYRLKYNNKYMDVVFEQFKGNKRITTFLPPPKEPQYPIIDSAVYNKILQDVKRV